MPTVGGRTHILNRLKSVDGHLRGVIKMVAEDAYCMDVIKQLQAVQSAIGRVNALLLEDHLQTCVSTAIKSDEPRERERVIGELLALFEQGARLDQTAAGALDTAMKEVSHSQTGNSNGCARHQNN
jgi:CsoR family transcriptional regulator, copper-sensing transcriptional repressor